MYKTGGLEQDAEDVKTMSVDGITYVVSDKFRSMLRDSFIDWGTFLEVYNKNLDYVNMFDQITKLLNIKENENLRDFMIPLVKKIYHLPADAHMACMLKQFMIYEPVSISIHSLFTTIKQHFESLVEHFLNIRNLYIMNNQLGDKPNDYQKLLHRWHDMNSTYNLETSSIILLFLNPPSGLKSGLNFSVTGKEDVINPLKIAVKKFKYEGFCHKVPHKRLISLLEFPVNDFIVAIKALNPSAVFPDYSFLEKSIMTALKSLPKKPVITDKIKREVPPKKLESLELAKWYVDAILDLRKNLLPDGKKYEDYFILHAEILKGINEMVKKEFLRTT